MLSISHDRNDLLPMFSNVNSKIQDKDHCSETNKSELFVQGPVWTQRILGDEKLTAGPPHFMVQEWQTSLHFV